jgi:ubiquinone/menaquinone biosynthesis C-methylase UbiE
VYETGPLRDVTGTTIRPGGLTLTDRALEQCSFAAGAQLLDVGCGAGGSVEHLRVRYGFDARGVDISPMLICEGLQRNPDLPLSEGTAEAVPYPDKSQDGILCECVLSLLEEPFHTLTEFRRLLRSGGCLILSDMYSREVSTGVRPAEPDILPPLQGVGWGGDGVRSDGSTWPTVFPSLSRSGGPTWR